MHAAASCQEAVLECWWNRSPASEAAGLLSLAAKPSKASVAPP